MRLHTAHSALIFYMALLGSTVGYRSESCIDTAATSLDATCTNETSSEAGTKVLSRRKRFLAFPDGSSFQLESVAILCEIKDQRNSIISDGTSSYLCGNGVFCTQTHGYLQVGDIVWFGNTAALAWQLPQNPEYLNSFKVTGMDYTAPSRRGDTKHIYYLDDDGKVIEKIPYRRKPIINPAFAKRSVDSASANKIVTREQIQLMHSNHDEMYAMKNGLANVDFHRKGRRELYEKIEVLLDGLGYKGKQCVLQMLCLSGKKNHLQSHFYGELLRAVFTLPGGQSFEESLHQEYDTAHAAQGDCVDLYPECERIEN